MCNTEYFVVAKPDMSFTCFHVSILDWAKQPDNRMCRYVQTNPNRPVYPDGTGSRPIRNTYYYPLPLDNNFRIYLPARDFNIIQKRIQRGKLQYFYLGDSKMITLGNCQGVFGVSALHGQLPGEPVYPINFIRERRITPRSRTPEDQAPQQNPHVKEALAQIASQKGEVIDSLNAIMGDYNYYQDILVEEELTEAQLFERFPASEDIINRERQLRSRNRELSIRELRLRPQLFNPDWRPPAPPYPPSTPPRSTSSTESESHLDTPPAASQRTTPPPIRRGQSPRTPPPVRRVQSPRTPPPPQPEPDLIQGSADE
jgi:hypothetical protein